MPRMSNKTMRFFKDPTNKKKQFKISSNSDALFGQMYALRNIIRKGSMKLSTVVNKGRNTLVIIGHCTTAP